MDLVANGPGGREYWIDYARVYAALGDPFPTRRIANELRRKHRKYRELAKARQAIFIPAVHLGFGRRAEAVTKFLKHVFDEAKDQQLHGSDGTFSSWVCQKRVELSVQLVRARSRLILDRAAQLRRDAELGRLSGDIGGRYGGRRCWDGPRCGELPALAEIVHPATNAGVA